MTVNRVLIALKVLFFAGCLWLLVELVWAAIRM
jgi:hypothetical protein